MTVNDFFCGCGGIGLAFRQAGFDVIWACDFDRFAVETYRHNVGEYVVQADVRKLKGEDIPIADVWTFGFPCQDLSYAGKQKGLVLRCLDCGKTYELFESDTKHTCPKCGSVHFQAESRSGLFFEMMRLLDEVAFRNTEQLPRVLFIENVKGLKKYLDVLEKELVKRGYIPHVQLFDSKYFGVAQHRERYYIVAFYNDTSKFEFPKEQHEYVPKLSEFLDKDVPEKFYLSQEKAQSVIEQARKDPARVVGKHGSKAQLPVCTARVKDNGRTFAGFSDIAPTLAARDYKGIGKKQAMVAVIRGDFNGNFKKEN